MGGMTSIQSAPRAVVLRCKIWFMIVVVSFTAIMPRPARALFGVGDIVHDPLMFAGVMGQTGAQLAQLVQMYYMLVEFKNRYGSLTKIKTWQKLLKAYAVRSLQNLARQIIYDIHKRGARITAETPTNPVLSAMISGRRKLAAMENRFRRADDLKLAYNHSQFSIAKLDREQALKEKQAKADAAAAADNGDGDAPAVAQNPQAYNTAQGNTYSSVPSGDGSTAGTTGTAANIAALNLKPSTTAEDGTTVPSTDESNGAGELVNPKFANNPGLVTPTDHESGDIASAAGFEKASAEQAAKMVQDAKETLDAGILQEHDAAIDYGNKATEKLAENQENIMSQNMKGPEPYLSHIIAQNDTVIQMKRFELNAQRAREEREQLDSASKRPAEANEAPLNAAAQTEAIKRVKSAAKGN